MSFLSEFKLSGKNGMSAAVTTKDWLKFICLSFLNFIPIVGTLIYFGVLVYLAVSKDTAESVKSYVRASLVFLGIAVALGIVLGIVFAGWLVMQFSALAV